MQARILTNRMRNETKRRWCDFCRAGIVVMTCLSMLVGSPMPTQLLAAPPKKARAIARQGVPSPTPIVRRLTRSRNRRVRGQSQAPARKWPTTTIRKKYDVGNQVIAPNLTQQQTVLGTQRKAQAGQQTGAQQPFAGAVAGRTPVESQAATRRRLNQRGTVVNRDIPLIDQSTWNQTQGSGKPGAINGQTRTTRTNGLPNLAQRGSDGAEILNARERFSPRIAGALRGAEIFKAADAKNDARQMPNSNGGSSLTPSEEDSFPPQEAPGGGDQGGVPSDHANNSPDGGGGSDAGGGSAGNHSPQAGGTKTGDDRSTEEKNKSPYYEPRARGGVSIQGWKLPDGSIGRVYEMHDGTYEWVTQKTLDNGWVATQNIKVDKRGKTIKRTVKLKRPGEPRGSWNYQYNYRGDGTLWGMSIPSGSDYRSAPLDPFTGNKPIPQAPKNGGVTNNPTNITNHKGPSGSPGIQGNPAPPVGDVFSLEKGFDLGGSGSNKKPGGRGNPNSGSETDSGSSGGSTPIPGQEGRNGDEQESVGGGGGTSSGGTSGTGGTGTSGGTGGGGGTGGNGGSTGGQQGGGGQEGNGKEGDGKTGSDQDAFNPIISKTLNNDGSETTTYLDGTSTTTAPDPKKQAHKDEDDRNPNDDDDSDDGGDDDGDDDDDDDPPPDDEDPPETDEYTPSDDAPPPGTAPTLNESIAAGQIFGQRLTTPVDPMVGTPGRDDPWIRAIPEKGNSRPVQDEPTPAGGINVDNPPAGPRPDPAPLTARVAAAVRSFVGMISPGTSPGTGQRLNSQSGGNQQLDAEQEGVESVDSR